MIAPPNPPRCTVCGSPDLLELCDPAGLILCPNCGNLLQWFRERLVGVSLESELAAIKGVDSLDVVELIMEVEADYDIVIPDEDAAKIKTVADLIRYIRRRRFGSPD